MRAETLRSPIARRRQIVLAGWCGVTLGLALGCDMPPHVRATRDAPLFDDVTNIMASMRAKPWLNFDPANPTRVNGLVVNVYLISGSARKGVFGSGIIRVILYEDLSGAGGGKVRPDAKKATGKKLFEWELPPERAMPYRAVRRPDRSYVMGDGYQLRLSWGDADLAEKRAAVLLEYQRADGQIVRRKPFWVQIPRSG